MSNVEVNPPICDFIAYSVAYWQVTRCMKLLQQLQLSDLVGDLSQLSSSAGLGMPSSASIVMFDRCAPYLYVCLKE